MDSVIFYFLPGIILLGIITSYYDIKENRIPNFAILGAVIYALIMNLILIFFLQSNFQYYTAALTNALIAFIVSFLLFHFKVWAPGDAKLFFAYVLLMPLSAYKNFFILYFPSAIFFTNTFIIAAVFTLPSFFKKIKKFKRWKKFSSPKNLLLEFAYFLFAFLSLSWVMGIFRGSLEGNFVLYTIVFLVYKFGKRALKNRKTIFGIILGLILAVRLIFYPETFSKSFFLSFIKFSTIFFLLKKLFLDVYSEVNSKKIESKKLKPYMVLDQKIKVKKEKFEKGTLLKSDEIQKLKKTKVKIYVKETIPFAPLLFIGALATVFISGEIIHWVLALLK